MGESKARIPALRAECTWLTQRPTGPGAAQEWSREWHFEGHCKDFRFGFK